MPARLSDIRLSPTVAVCRRNRPLLRNGDEPLKWKVNAAALGGSGTYHTYGTRRYRTLLVYSV